MNMASGKVLRENYDIVRPGTYVIGVIIAAGYNTGSGNYFDFTIPIRVHPSLTVSTVSFNVSTEPKTAIFLSNHGRNVDLAGTATVVYKNEAGIICEVKYDATKIGYENGIIYTNNLTIVVT